MVETAPLHVVVIFTTVEASSSMLCFSTVHVVPRGSAAGIIAIISLVVAVVVVVVAGPSVVEIPRGGVGRPPSLTSRRAKGVVAGGREWVV